MKDGSTCGRAGRFFRMIFFSFFGAGTATSVDCSSSPVTGARSLSSDILVKATCSIVWWFGLMKNSRRVEVVRNAASPMKR